MTTRRYTTREEVVARMERLEELRFELKMKDFWNHEDWRRDRAWASEYYTLFKTLHEFDNKVA